MSSTNGQIVFLRYWGSFFKSFRQAKNLATQFEPLVRRNWRCHLVLGRLPEDASWLEPFHSLGVSLVVLPRPKGNFDFRCVARSFALCRKIRCDVFHCDNLHTSPLLGALFGRVRVRIWSKRGMSPHYAQEREPTFREKIALSIRLSAFCVTKIIAVSTQVRRELLEMGISPERVVVRHNPRTLPANEVGTGHDPIVVRQTLGWAPADIVAITVGHSVRVKGWDLLLDAFARVARIEPRARLVFVGSHTAGHERECYGGLQRQIANYDLKSRVTFTGHLGDITGILTASDLFVMPSRSEGFSLALVEALQAGLPCIATRVGIAEDVIEEDINGFLVDRSDVDSLAQRLLQVVGDEALRKRLAKNVTVPTCIPTLDEYAENTARDYEELLGSKTRFLAVERPASV